MANLHEAANELSIANWHLDDALTHVRGTAHESEIVSIVAQLDTLKRAVDADATQERKQAYMRTRQETQADER